MKKSLIAIGLTCPSLPWAPSPRWRRRPHRSLRPIPASAASPVVARIRINRWCSTLRIISLFLVRNRYIGYIGYGYRAKRSEFAQDERCIQIDMKQREDRRKAGLGTKKGVEKCSSLSLTFAAAPKMGRPKDPVRLTTARGDISERTAPLPPAAAVWPGLVRPS